MKIIARRHEGEGWSGTLIGRHFSSGKNIDFFYLGAVWGRVCWTLDWSRNKESRWPIIPKLEVYWLSNHPLYQYRPDQGGYPDKRII